MERVVEALGLRALLDRAPSDLSGGERGRVSLGRALLSPARLALLDEPTAGLDAGMRMRTLALVREAAEWGKIVVYVSHSPGEVYAVTDHVIAMDRGRVMGEGLPMNVLTAGPVLALWREEGFENVFEAIADADGVRAGTALWRAGRPDLKPGEKVTVGLPASDVILARDRPESLSARNVLPGEVTRVSGSSEVVLATVDVGGVPIAVELTPAATKDLGIATGARVWVVVKATSLRVTRSA
jgi:molybdate transport system ATP-binding protein